LKDFVQEIEDSSDGTNDKMHSEIQAGNSFTLHSIILSYDSPCSVTFIWTWTRTVSGGAKVA